MSEKKVDIDVSGGLFWCVLLVFILGTCEGGYEIRRTDRQTTDGRETRWGIQHAKP